MSKIGIEEGGPSSAELLAGQATAILDAYRLKYGAHDHANMHDVGVLGELIDLWQRYPNRFYVAGTPRLERSEATSDNPQGTINVAEVEFRDEFGTRHTPSLVVRARTPKDHDILEEFVEGELAQKQPSEFMIGRELKEVRRGSQQAGGQHPSKLIVDVSSGDWRVRSWNRGSFGDDVYANYRADGARARIVYDPLTMTSVARGHSGTHNGVVSHNFQSGATEGLVPGLIFPLLRNAAIQTVKRAQTRS